ncbi:MAG: DUF1080 domain-containing protein [Verrucomicrobiota bacterium]
MRHIDQSFVGGFGLGLALAAMPLPQTAAADLAWKSLFNGKDLSGWDTWLGPASGGYHDPNSSKEKPIGLNKDPLGIFTIISKDGAPAIRISGQVFGAITSHEQFGNCHIRVSYKWGEKKWPPRHEPKHYRDSGILYWCIGEHGAGSYAWMRSVECNIMEKGVGQWWSVAGSYVDIEGRKVVLEKDPRVPYRGEGPGEQCIVWEPGAPRFTTSEGITSLLDPEKPGEWNVCEVIAWGNIGIHLLNGEVVLVVLNPRYKEGSREIRFDRGKIQLQSEGAELFYRSVEARAISEIPASLLKHVPPTVTDETGFVPLLTGDNARHWKQCGPGKFDLRDGIATGEGGMGLWWYAQRPFTNFVLRGEWMQEGAESDSGIFMRFPDPGNDPWVAVKQGHEFEIGDPQPAQGKEATGSFYPFHSPVQVAVKPWGEWNSYELTCIGPNYSLRINGQLVNTWTDDQKRPLAGYIGLQNYPYKQAVRHRNLRIKELL